MSQSIDPEITSPKGIYLFFFYRKLLHNIIRLIVRVSLHENISLLSIFTDSVKESSDRPHKNCVNDVLWLILISLDPILFIALTIRQKVREIILFYFCKLLFNSCYLDIQTIPTIFFLIAFSWAHKKERNKKKFQDNL
jgi:hypothetical protein